MPALPDARRSRAELPPGRAPRRLHVPVLQAHVVRGGPRASGDSQMSGGSPAKKKPAAPPRAYRDDPVLFVKQTLASAGTPYGKQVELLQAAAAPPSVTQSNQRPSVGLSLSRGVWYASRFGLYSALP